MPTLRILLDVLLDAVPLLVASPFFLGIAYTVYVVAQTR